MGVGAPVVVRSLTAAIGVLVALAGCERAKSAEKPAPPPPAVVVAAVEQRTVPIVRDFTARTERREFRVQQELLTRAAEDTSRLADIRYKGGVSSYLEVLDSERQRFEAELGLVRSYRDDLLAVVRLYKALGGGWQE